ncbi:MAG: hypothetical protein GWM98_15425 [Nitrospinaceae bacterium]|nr:hypothetical protein [Nitrospinaceae bacterium]NIR55615.1 hypothetical protein [Nitrospinaceae bacterium]NIT82892.1 hypothetical protein [Nitrospinaceae bacterium]NIW06680.1 hypothetical protein [Nitrospinaceae bacterium]NIX35245.1 hypothetical protein [Nitrospinaceae bacterium]
MADLIPPKVLKAVRDNVKLKPCCRDVETSHVQTFQSHPGMVAGIADLMEITCDCGRTQYRTHANVGNVNGPEPYGN